MEYKREENDLHKKWFKKIDLNFLSIGFTDICVKTFF